MASTLEWWPGSPHDVSVEPVLERIDADRASSSLPLVLAVKTERNSFGRASQPKPAEASGGT